MRNVGAAFVKNRGERKILIYIIELVECCLWTELSLRLGSNFVSRLLPIWPSLAWVELEFTLSQRVIDNGETGGSARVVGWDTMDCHDNGCSSLSFNSKSNGLEKKKGKFRGKTGFPLRRKKKARQQLSSFALVRESLRDEITH